MDKSKMGYRDDSPFRKEPFIDINTPNGIIDMSATGIPLFANGKLLLPYSGTHQFNPGIVREVPLAQTGWEVPKRKGVRLNYDKEGNVVGESTHIMRTETDGKGNWFSFPTLFQNEDGTWVDMSISLEEPWEPAYQEALKRGEVIDFGKDKEAAIKFGEGSWKKKLRRGGSLPRAQEGFEIPLAQNGLDKYGSPIGQNLVTGTTTKSDNTKVNVPSVSSLLNTTDKKIDIIKTEDQKEKEYFNPEIKDISSGDWRLDAVYKNPWLMDVPVLGNLIKDQAKSMASSTGGAPIFYRKPKNLTQEEDDLWEKYNTNYHYDGNYRDNIKTSRASLLDQYFSEKPLLPLSTHKPKSDYLEFLPRYSLKTKETEELFNTNKNIIKEILKRDHIFGYNEYTEKKFEDFIKNKKTIYNEKIHSHLGTVLNVDLGGHSLGMAWDDEVNLPYVSIADAWDFSPEHYSKKWGMELLPGEDASQAYIQASLMHKAGNPFKVYDRFYFDPETKEYISDEDIESRQSKSTAKKELRNGGSLPQAQVGKGLDYVSGLDGNVIIHEDEALQNANQKNLDSAKDFAGKWMNSPRYLEMLNNSGGSEWWNRAGDVQRGRISNFNKLQDAPLYISNDPNPYYSEKALSDVAGYSQNETGKIYVDPKFGGRMPTLYDHEISHSIDRPVDNFLLTDIAQFYARGMDHDGRLIPNNDIDLIGNLIDPTLDIGKTVSFWESFGDTPEEGTRNYYSNPTEVRARLNEIRKDMMVNGVDVFNKEITYDDMPTSRVKAFRDLKKLYSEESILQMLNTISDTGTLPDADTLPAAQEGVEVGPKEAPEGYKWNGESLVPNDWSEFHDEVDDSSITVNFNDLEKGIRHVESLNGVLMKNPQSSASGFYGDLFDNFEKNGIEYDGDRDAFIADTTYQKNLFLERYNGDIKNVPGLESNGLDLYKEYTEDQSKITRPDGTPFVLDLTPTEIAALSNILGRKGTRHYIGYHLRDGKSLADVFPKLYGEERQLGKDGKPLENKTPEEYLQGFNAALEKKALGGSVNSARERTKKLVRQYKDGGSLTTAGRKHLEDIGVIDVFETGGEYIVKRGDVLSTIAKKNNMTTDALASMNNIGNIHSIYPGQRLQVATTVVESVEEEEEKPVEVGYDHHETFSGAFGAAREDLGVNHIFNYKGDSFTTNLAGEPVNIPNSVRTALGNQQDQVDSLYSSRGALNITAAQDAWQEWDQKRESIDDFNRMGNVDIITGYESGRLGGSNVESSVHSVEAGDNLSVLAQKYGSTVEDIMRANPNIDQPNNIKLGDQLNIPVVLGETYMILNKKTHELQAYRQGSDEPFATYLVGTGTIEGDAQTVTVSKDLNNDGIRGGEGDENARGTYNVDWRAGNSQTGAGIFTLDGIVENSQGYYDETGQGRSIPSFGLKNESGIRISTGIHGVPYGLRNTSRLTNTISDDITRKNMTHGCINGRCSDLREMYDNPGITEGTKLYILPEEEGNEFVYQNGKLVFKSSAENRKRYSEGYIDEDGNRQPYSQGINRSPNALNYKPIKIEFDRTKMQKDKNDASILEGVDFNNDEEYDEITAPFLKALMDNKQRIMNIAQVNGDTYNDMVKLTIGLFGQESGFGEKNSSIINASKFGKKAVSSFFDLGTSSSADPLFEQGAYEGVNAVNIAANKAAAMKGLPTQNFGIDINNKSVGWTQLRWNHTDDYEKSKLAQLGITSNSDFNDPVKAAIGTIAILSIRSQTQTNYQDNLIADNKEFAHITNRQEALIASWNPSGPEYINNVLKQGNYATVYEIDAKDVSGELKTTYDKNVSNSTIQNAVRLYEEYVEGLFEEGSEVKALYNKLNRVYYNDAKAAKTGVLDYMKSLVD